MANPVTVANRRKDSGGLAECYGSVSATYARSGSKVTITVSVTLTDGRGKYWGVSIDDVDVRYNELGTTTKTYTYDNAAAKTYSFVVRSYVQTATSYAGQTYTHDPLTIYVPAASGQCYAKVNGVWKKGSKVYTKVNGAWKEGIVKAKVSGAWK